MKYNISINQEISPKNSSDDHQILIRYKIRSQTIEKIFFKEALKLILKKIKKEKDKNF